MRQRTSASTVRAPTVRCGRSSRDGRQGGRARRAAAAAPASVRGSPSIQTRAGDRRSRAVEQPAQQGDPLAEPVVAAGDARRPVAGRCGRWSRCRRRRCARPRRAASRRSALVERVGIVGRARSGRRQVDHDQRVGVADAGRSPDLPAVQLREPAAHVRQARQPGQRVLAGELVQVARGSPRSSDARARHVGVRRVAAADQPVRRAQRRPGPRRARLRPGRGRARRLHMPRLEPDPEARASPTASKRGGSASRSLGQSRPVPRDSPGSVLRGLCREDPHVLHPLGPMPGVPPPGFEDGTRSADHDAILRTFRGVPDGRSALR